jgi:catalase
MADTVKNTVQSRRVSILVADGVDAGSLRWVREALLVGGALPVLVAPRLGPVADSNGREHWVEQSLLTGSSVLFDAVYVPGGSGAATLAWERDAIDWVCEAWRHCKPIAASGTGLELLARCPGILDDASESSSRDIGDDLEFGDGLVVSQDAATQVFAANFVAAIAQHRFWERGRRNRLEAGAVDRETRGAGMPSRRGTPVHAQA